MRRAYSQLKKIAERWVKTDENLCTQTPYVEIRLAALRRSRACDDIHIHENCKINFRTRLLPNCSFYLSPVTQREVISLLKAVKGTSFGFDEISPSFVQHTARTIFLPLTQLLNLTLKKGVFFFPDELKKTKIISMFMSGNRDDIHNYRPILIFPVFSSL